VIRVVFTCRVSKNNGFASTALHCFSRALCKLHCTCNFFEFQLVHCIVNYALCDWLVSDYTLVLVL